MITGSKRMMMTLKNKKKMRSVQLFPLFDYLRIVSNPLVPKV